MNKKYNIIENFGKNVKKYMELKKINTKELSVKTGISEKYIKKIINGNAIGAKMSHGLKISSALKIKFYYLLDEE